GLALAEHMRAAGRSVDVLGGASVAAGDEAVVRQEVDAWLAVPGAVAGVIHLAGLSLPDPAEAPASLLETQHTSVGSLLGLVQALAGRAYDAGAMPRLWLATRGAVATDNLARLALAQSPLWGFARSLALEHPELRCTRVDLDPDLADDIAAETLVERLRDNGAEDQLAQREGSWRGARLIPVEAPAKTVVPMRLEKGSHGLIDELALQPMTRRAPGPGEVKIRVAAAGLNFRDLMNVLAMRDDPEPLGGECAGRVVAVGEGVAGLAPGDPVVAIAEASFATHATTSAALVRPLPAGVGFAEAATLPFAFMTAWHALHTLGAVQPGETVLIHAGAGGVGMAALQIAQAAGARVFATAGSEEKRALLRSMGVAQVFDSRSLAFAEGVLAATGGRGVDLLLNSLAGDFIAASVRCLADEGRFLEIGKRDIWTPERFATERPAGRYHAIDLAAMRYQDPAGTAILLDRVLAEVTAGRLRPLPLQAFPLTRAADGFRHMAMARHVGKVVLVEVDNEAASLDALRPDATYLVTGGLSGLGLLTAAHLVHHGARHLLLVGRRAPGVSALSEVERLRAAGATVTVQQVDVADPAAVQRLVAGVGAAAPLRGVVHSAGLLEDGALLQQTWPRFVRPLGPKVDGAWALHLATRHLPLDFFVLYSSIASVFGSAGQANHAAANAFMDALAQHRQALGLPALSIGWGAWSEVGAAAERQVDQLMGAKGLDVIAPPQGLAWLEQLMAAGAAHVAATPIRWGDFLTGDRDAEPFFSHCRPQREREEAASPGAAPPAATLAADLAGATPTRRQALLLGFVADNVARVIGAASREAIDPRQPLNELGLDSLMAVELRNRLGSGLGLPRSLPATLVFDYPTLEALAAFLERELLGPDVAVPVSAAPEPPADAVETIDDMSDEEIEKLFAKKLGRA
ncbi:MAG: SDR family NAD(P)-dependent oxidoreductase, partial [Rhodocyclaceae bacterium]